MTEPDAGFTLIETIVALVILSGVLIGFYSFLSTTLNAAGRLEAASLAYDRHENALELARAVNPLAMPEGRFDLDGYHIEWTSQTLQPPRQSSRYPVGVGVFQVGLYAVTFRFPGTDVAPITVTKLGYHQTMSPQDLLKGAAGAAATP